MLPITPAGKPVEVTTMVPVPPAVQPGGAGTGHGAQETTRLSDAMKRRARVFMDELKSTQHANAQPRSFHGLATKNCELRGHFSEPAVHGAL